MMSRQIPKHEFLFSFFQMAALRFNVNYVNRTINTVEDDDMLPHVIQAPLKSHATLRLTI